MLPGQNYKELIQEHGQIQYRIADGLGYQINPTQYAPKKLKIQSSIKVVNMQTLKISVDIPVSKRLQSIEQQILMMQNQRKLNLMTEQARRRAQKGGQKLQQQSPAVKMMHQLIDQYNFIVDHRHILQKNTEKARKILGIKKTTSQVINQQIQALRQQLATSSLTDVIRINQQIATLYRQYQKNLFHQSQKSKISPSTLNNSVAIKKSTPVQKSRTNTSGISHKLVNSQFSPMKKTSKAKSQAQTSQKLEFNNKQQNFIELKDLKIMKQLNESEQAESTDNYHKLDFNQNGKVMYQPQSMILQNFIHKIKRRTSEFGGRRRVFTLSDNDQKEKERKKQRMIKTISQSFDNKQLIEKGKNLDKTLRQNQDVIEIWRHKVSQNLQKNQRNFIKYQPKPKKFKNKVKDIKSQQNYNSQKIEYEQGQKKIKSNNLFSRLAQIRQETAQKQKILSIIIKKKQNKYKRIPGTKILHQVNTNQIAKNFLGTAKRQQSRNSSRHNNSCMQNMTAQQDITDVPEWMDIGYGNDQQLYWSMCRNQKLNLLLKHKKK